jgi:hypothetical protein
VKQRMSHFNPKRKLGNPDEFDLADLEARVQYGGNPEHKRYPLDYGLTPPASARPGKSLCDQLRSIRKTEALALLQQGLKSGLISERVIAGWPQNIWTVTNAEIYEAQLENAELGFYHGYPMPLADVFRERILDRLQHLEQQS